MWNTTPDTSASLQPALLRWMLGLYLHPDEHRGRPSRFITIPQSVCHPVGKPTEGPCLPGQVFNTQ